MSEFYSIFIEKTYTIIYMEINCYLKLLYYIIMGFYSLKNLKEWKVVVSDLDVAKVEMIDFNSKLKLKTQNIGSTNIILLHP